MNELQSGGGRDLAIIQGGPDCIGGCETEERPKALPSGLEGIAAGQGESRRPGLLEAGDQKLVHPVKERGAPLRQE
jgi:hypothetical protein